MENKGKKIVSSLAVLTAVAGGVSVINTFVSKMTKTLLYRYHKDEYEPGILETTYNGKSVYIKNEQGIKLRGVLITEDNADKTLVILHPFGLQAEDMSLFVPFFKEKMDNTNILVLDACGHGQSDGYIRGFGLKDVDDITSWIKYLQGEYGKNHSIILYGKEAGANTILNAAGKQKIKGVKAIISDGAFTSVYDILGERLVKDYKVVKFPTLSLLKRKIYREVKMNIKESTVDNVKHNDIPTLYIHTKNDDFVPLQHVYSLYNANRGKKELFVLKDERYLYELKETDAFKKTFSQFLTKYVK
ncbi:MAG: alpha/beta hydrolase [Coprobacillaceae bacterium]